MKIKAQKLLDISGSLQTLLNLRFEAAVSFRLRHFVKAVRTELQALEATRHELVMKHGTKDQAGNTSVQEPKALQEFTAAWSLVTQEEVELPDVTITIEELGRAKLVLPGVAGPIETTMTATEIVDIEEVVSYGTAK